MVTSDIKKPRTATPSGQKLNSRAAKPESLTLTPPTSHKSTRPKSVSSPDDKKETKLIINRSLILTKPKSGELKNNHRPVVEQFASRPRRHKTTSDLEEESSKKELFDKLQKSEALVKNLEAEVLNLKGELDKAHGLNQELESLNKKLGQDLDAAQAKISALTNSDQESGEHRISKFKDIRKLIANKLEQSTVKKLAMNGPTALSLHQSTPPLPPPPRFLSVSRSSDTEIKISSMPPPPRFLSVSRSSDTEIKISSMPPPPPPLPPTRPLARAATAPKKPAIVEFYHSLKKEEEKRDGVGVGNRYKPAVPSAHSSIVGEIQNRSAHLLAIKSDIETKGEFINGLIRKVLDAGYTDIEDVLEFVDWLDRELSSLADERAVLKHFDWPERKADAMREAAIEYRALKLLEGEISSFTDNPDFPCETAIRKMGVLLDKSERGIQRLIQLRRTVMRSYQEWKIPINWMLDSGIMRKIKQAAMKLANTYMKRVRAEVELAHKLDRESNQEALLLQSVQFTYRIHQFAGGLDSETLYALEEIRLRVPGRLGRSQELLAARTSSSQ